MSTLRIEMILILNLLCSVIDLIFNVQQVISTELMFVWGLVMIFNVKYFNSKNCIHMNTELVICGAWISFHFQGETCQFQEFNTYHYLLCSLFGLVLISNMKHLNSKSWIGITIKHIIFGVWVRDNFQCEMCQLQELITYHYWTYYVRRLY